MMKEEIQSQKLGIKDVILKKYIKITKLYKLYFLVFLKSSLHCNIFWHYKRKCK